MQLLCDLRIVVTCEDSHNARHRPRHARTLVRAADRVDDGTTHEVRVLSAQDHVACVLVDGVVDIQVSEERRREQRWDVRIIHDVLRAEAVDFESVDLAVRSRVDDAVLGDCIAEVVGHVGHAGGEGGAVRAA